MYANTFLRPGKTYELHAKLSIKAINDHHGFEHMFCQLKES